METNPDNKYNHNHLDSKQEGDLLVLFKELYEIVVLLRGPDGCPWDKKQTPRSLRNSIIEEAYECVSAIDESSNENLCEELGDLLLVISMIIRIKEQENAFTYKEVLRGICDKLIRRHPHVFRNENLKTPDEVIMNWEKIKTDIEGKKPKHSILENIPGAFPPLEKALTIQKKVSKVGFDWKEVEPVWEKLDEEIRELKTAIKTNINEDIEEELGDILFTIVNIGRLLKINPATALHRTNEKFIKRFYELEERIRKKNIKLENAGLKMLDSIWDEIKNQDSE